MSRLVRRYGLMVAVVVAPALALLQSGASQAAVCGYTGYHYYSYAQSGAGTNTGTGAEMQTWTHWSLGGHSSSNSPTPFSNEAVWTRDYDNINNAVEVGFITGEANEGTFSNAMYPYYTLNDGACPCGYFTSTSLPTDTVIWNSATSNGTDSWAYVNNKLLAERTYGVSTPRQNFEQAEVDYHDIWMGGGSGVNVALEYQTPDNQWHDWGSITGGTERYDPVTGTDGGAAGYGYVNETDAPNGAFEGGYGQSC